MSDRIRLGDDGTLDTVLVCRECGQETRYNYDGYGPDESDRDTQLEALAEEHPNDSLYKLADRLDERAYAEFIEWAIADFDSEHECERADADTDSDN